MAIKVDAMTELRFKEDQMDTSTKGLSKITILKSVQVYTNFGFF